MLRVVISYGLCFSRRRGRYRCLSALPTKLANMINMSVIFPGYSPSLLVPKHPLPARNKSSMRRRPHQSPHRAVWVFWSCHRWTAGCDLPMQQLCGSPSRPLKISIASHQASSHKCLRQNHIQRIHFFINALPLHLNDRWHKCRLRNGQAIVRRP